METLVQRCAHSGRHLRQLTTTFTAATQNATAELAERTLAASAGWLGAARDASGSWLQQSRGAAKQVWSGLREEGQTWQQFVGSRALVVRLHAPAGLREVTRQSLMRRLELERTALERVRQGLQELDEKLQERLSWLDQVPANRAELALPPGYDELSAREITAESAHWGHTEVLAALTHEQSTKERSTVLGTLQRRLDGLQHAS